MTRYRTKHNPPEDMNRLTRLRKRIEHRIEYGVVLTLIWIGSVVPIRILRRLGASLGWFAYRVIRIRRTVVLDNIRHAMPDGDNPTVDGTALRAYQNFGRSVMEVLALKHLTKKQITGMTTVEGLEHLDEAVERGNGAILFTAHLGNWELFAAIVSRLGYPIHVTDTDHTNKLVHGVMDDLRQSQGVQSISPREPVSYLARLLSGNQFIAYLPDQDARGAGVFVEYFGRPAWTLRGPAVLAIRKRSPMIPSFLIREGDDHHRALFLPAIWPAADLRGNEAIQDLTQRYTDVLAEFVTRHPDQYFWMHRRWKTQPGTAKV